MPLNKSSTVDNNFVHPGLLAGQPLNTTDLAKFTTEGTLDNSLPASIKPKDKGFMTVNDKVFAVRNNLVVPWTAVAFMPGSYVSYQGKTYYTAIATLETDIPGTATMWKRTQAPV